MDCGHYIHGKLDFDTDNLKPQCTRCNKWLSGNLGKYAEHLIADYGEEWLKKLRRKAEIKGNDYKRAEINELIEYYKNI